ncbi:MAG: hypothetical protein WAL92_08855 [Thiogranum sp.]|jgi:hypothetical protein
MKPNDSAEIIYLKPEFAVKEKRRVAMTTEYSHKIGLVLHVDDSLPEPRRTHIEVALASEQGVTSARFTERRPHLMVVEYDPDVTSSVHILNKVTSHRVRAELIGPI